MKFKRIKLENYRCFKYADVKFNTNKDKPITLFLGNNGSGKSEFLYSFWWILYDVNFAAFKGKGRVPYSLNLDVENQLLLGNIPSAKVTGELFFEVDEAEYKVVKKEYFSVNRKNKVEPTRRECYLYNHFGKTTWNVMATDEEVASKLADILPENLLSGIIFDGEFMMEMADPKASAKKNGINAIKGVISKVIDVSVISDANSIFSETVKGIRKTLQRQSKNDIKLGQLTEQFNEASVRREEILATKKKVEEDLIQASSVYDALRSKAAAAEELKGYIAERDRINNILAVKKENMEESYKDFVTDLKKGYLLLSKPLTDKILSMTDNHDIPADLTVKAAESIMAMDHCICGREMNDEVREVIKNLIQYLPPANINSTLKEMAYSVIEAREKAEKDLKESYQKYSKDVRDIKNDKLALNRLAPKIGETTHEDVVETCYKFANAEEAKDYNEAELKRLIRDLDDVTKQTEKLQKDIKSISSDNQQYSTLNKRRVLYEKYIESIRQFNEKQEMIALDSINEKLNKAYSLLSEDYANDRRVAIGRYKDSARYKIIPYNQRTVEQKARHMKESGEFAKEFEIYQSICKDDKEALDRVYEDLIINNAEPSSPGQMSIQALAFVKAVLDYATSVTNDLLSQSVSYPLVIDAPLSNVGGENLVKASLALPSFAEQMIYLSMGSSYKLIERNMGQFVGAKYYFEKQEGEHSSLIVKEA